MNVCAAVAALLLVVGVVINAVVGGDDDTVDSYLKHSGIAGRAELRIGVFPDEPLMSYRRPDRPNSTKLADFTGFDVEIARSLARYLGYNEDAVQLIETQVQDRERNLADNRVDIVIASYSITEERKQRVAFAGPYLRTQPEVLMRAAQAPERITFRQLDQLPKPLCTSGSSTSDRALREHDVRNFDGVGQSRECFEGLVSGKYDAFVLDEVVLAGYRLGHESQVKLVDLVFDQDESYGIGVAKEDTYLQTVIGNFLLDSYERKDTGAWQQAWNRTLGRILGDRRQPKPDEVQRLRDYRDRSPT